MVGAIKAPKAMTVMLTAVLAMTLVYPQQVTLYQVGDLVEGASFNNFLDGIDASYCTFEGGTF